jgi:AcrR family transcriptional regulator
MPDEDSEVAATDKKRGKRSVKRAYHHGQLREALIKAAVEIVEADGVAGLTLRKAARRAGVSHAAPGHHFGDMPGLLAAVATEGLRTLHAALVGAYEAAPEDAHRERLQATALADRSRDAELEEASQATFGVLVEAIVACQAAGVVREGDPKELALAAWSVVHGLAMLAVDHQLRGKGFRQDPRDLAATLTTHLFAGLKAPDSGDGVFKFNFLGRRPGPKPGVWGAAK